MQKGSTADAMQFMNRFKRRFREDAFFTSKIRKQVCPLVVIMPVGELLSSCKRDCLFVCHCQL